MYRSPATVSEPHDYSLPKKNIFLSWQDFKEDDLNELDAIVDSERRRERMTQILQLLSRYPTDESMSAAERARNHHRRAILLDLISKIYNFCKHAQLSATKTSTLLSITKALNTACCELHGPGIPLKKAFGLFRTILLRHSVERPPFSTAVFSYTDVTAISDFFLRSYFRHLKLYQYVFGMASELDLQIKESLAQPLDEHLVSLSTGTYTELLVEAMEPAEAVESKDQEEELVVQEVALDMYKWSPPPMPSLETLTREDRNRFEGAFSGELVRIQQEFQVKMKQQQEEFDARLADIVKLKAASKESLAAPIGSTPNSRPQSSQQSRPRTEQKPRLVGSAAKKV